MSTIMIFKAQKEGETQLPNCEIAIQGEFPILVTRQEEDNLFNNEAVAIEKALHDSLPGGTYDRVASKMLERKASHYIRSWGERE